MVAVPALVLANNWDCLRHDVPHVALSIYDLVGVSVNQTQLGTCTPSDMNKL